MGFKFPWDRTDEYAASIDRALRDEISKVFREMRTLDKHSDRRIVDVNDRIESVANRVYKIEKQLRETQKLLNALCNVPTVPPENINTKTALFLYASCVLSSAFAACIAASVMLDLI